MVVGAALVCTLWRAREDAAHGGLYHRGPCRVDGQAHPRRVYAPRPADALALALPAAPQNQLPAMPISAREQFILVAKFCGAPMPQPEVRWGRER